MIHGFPLQYVIGGLVVVSLAGGLYGLGHRAGLDSCRAGLAEHLSRAAEQARQIALQDAAVSAQAAKVIHAIREIEKRVEVEVVNEIPADCSTCALSPRGRGLLNDAITGRAYTPADPAPPAGTLPAPIAPPRWQLPGSGREIGGIQRQAL